MTVGVIFRLLAVMLLWASCFPLITLGLDLAPHLAFAAMRASLAGFCLILIGLLFRRPIPRSGRSWALITLVGFGATSLGFLGMFHAAEFVSPGLATVIANAQPLLAALLAHAVLKEKLTAFGKLGLITGFAGISAIAWPGLAAGTEPDYALGITYIVLAATGVSIGNIAIKRLTGEADVVMAMGFQLLIGAVPLMFLSIFTEDISALTWSVDFVLILGVLAVFGSSLAFWLWFTALENVELNRANAFTFLVPIFGLVIGSTLFDEQLVWPQAVGIVLVLAGIFFVQHGVRGKVSIQ
ncbi:DMT family transporter [Fodinicurvata halophila]|uniref:DMT family transporter n=2 Tax=Fodinicurvata halophila TaxID=1419723 RepID=A0ABV8UNL8_9PROT